jgi:dolichol-phosphate hexosyltransferase
MIKGYSVTVVIPTKNEAKGIAKTIERIPKGVDRILVIDGNSTDGTREIAKSLGCDVINEVRKGYGRAYLTAFETISTDLVATCDGDGTYPIEDLLSFIDRLDQYKMDFVNGSRFPLMDLNSMYFKNFWGNMALTFAFNTLYKTTVTDCLSGMWVFRSSLLKKMTLISENWNFSEEIKYEAIRCGARFGEQHILYFERIGETKMSPWKTGIENLMFMFHLLFKRGTLKSQIESHRQFQATVQQKTAAEESRIRPEFPLVPESRTPKELNH